jgi:hypothetical protein
LVQHDLKAVDGLADKMTGKISNRLKLVGLVSLVVVSLLLSGLWGWIMWTLHRGEGIAHA